MMKGQLTGEMVKEKKEEARILTVFFSFRIIVEARPFFGMKIHVRYQVGKPGFETT